MSNPQPLGCFSDFSTGDLDNWILNPAQPQNMSSMSCSYGYLSFQTHQTSSTPGVVKEIFLIPYKTYKIYAIARTSPNTSAYIWVGDYMRTNIVWAKHKIPEGNDGVIELSFTASTSTNVYYVGILLSAPKNNNGCYIKQFAVAPDDNINYMPDVDDNCYLTCRIHSPPIKTLLNINSNPIVRVVKLMTHCQNANAPTTTQYDHSTVCYNNCYNKCVSTCVNTGASQTSCRTSCQAQCMCSHATSSGCSSKCSRK